MKGKLITITMLLALIACAILTACAPKVEPSNSKLEDTGRQLPDGSWQYQLGDLTYTTKRRASDQVGDDGKLNLKSFLESYGWQQDDYQGGTGDFIITASPKIRADVRESAELIISLCGSYCYIIMTGFDNEGWELRADCHASQNGHDERGYKVDDNAVIPLKMAELLNFCLQSAGSPEFAAVLQEIGPSRNADGVIISSGVIGVDK